MSGFQLKKQEKIFLNHKYDFRLVTEVEKCSQFLCLGEIKDRSLSSKVISLLLFIIVILPLIGIIALSMATGLGIILDIFLNLNDPSISQYINPILYSFFALVFSLITMNIYKRIFKNKFDIDEDEIIIVVKDEEFPLSNRTLLIHEHIFDGLNNHYGKKN